MELDSETFRPTYRIVMGVAGVSAGLEIAERLGLAARIVDRARSLVDPHSRKGEETLRRLMESLSAAESAAAAARQELAELEQQRKKWSIRAAQEADRRRSEAQRALERVLEEFRRSARKELAGMRDRRDRAGAERSWSKAERRLEGEQDRLRREVEPDPRAQEETRARLRADQLIPGLRVFVCSLGREGEIREVEGREAEVQLGRITCRVSVDDLRAAAAGGERPSDGGSVEIRSAVIRRDCPRELVLVGRRVSDALVELDRFLDAASVAGHDEVRIVHGHGTGRLRSAVREFLSGHIQVRAHRGGRTEEGGDAATVVSLA